MAPYGLILTNSYKWLIIAYLSVPWTPEQDYNYFHQLQGFQFYASVPVMSESEYWKLCSHFADYIIEKNTTCTAQFNAQSHFVKYVKWSRIYGVGQIKNDTVLDLLDNSILVFPKNESSEVFRKLISSKKMALAGYSSEIDTVMVQGKAQVEKNFRGKKNLWPHNKMWRFPKITYCQPQIELVELMTTGIYQFWKYWIRDRKYIESKLKDESSDQLKPLSLNSNIPLVFVILTFGLGVSLFVLTVENIRNRLSKYTIRCWMKNWSRIRGSKLRIVMPRNIINWIWRDKFENGSLWKK